MTHWADATNGIFEAGTGLAACLSCWRIYRDKSVKGFSSAVMWWVTLWGYWNLYYYPSLNQWLSFTGGLLVVSANSFWLYLWLKYTGWLPYATRTQ